MSKRKYLLIKQLWSVYEEKDEIRELCFSDQLHLNVDADKYEKFIELSHDCMGALDEINNLLSV